MPHPSGWAHSEEWAHQLRWGEWPWGFEAERLKPKWLLHFLPGAARKQELPFCQGYIQKARVTENGKVRFQEISHNFSVVLDLAWGFLRKNKGIQAKGTDTGVRGKSDRNISFQGDG